MEEQRANVILAAMTIALFAVGGCFYDYTGDCSRNPEKDCFWGGVGGGGGGTTSLPPACSDGHLDPGESCDDGNTTDCDGCRGDCSAAETGCGDGYVCGLEECDEGAENSDMGACTTACKKN